MPTAKNTRATTTLPCWDAADTCVTAGEEDDAGGFAGPGAGSQAFVCGGHAPSPTSRREGRVGTMTNAGIKVLGN